MKRLLVGSLVLVMVSAFLPLSSQSAVAVERQRVAACSTVADSIAGTAKANQLITVIAATTTSVTATLDLYVRRGRCFQRADGPYPALVGRKGLSTHHREGDDTTPLGLFAFQSTVYGVLPNPGVAYHYHRLVCGDWWDEQSSSPLYNHFVHVACGTQTSFGGDSEALWETVPSYDYFAVIAYNRHPIVPGRGSAIFLHVADGRATTGCVSLPAGDLVRILRILRPNLHPLIDITTGALLTSSYATPDRLSR